MANTIRLRRGTSVPSGVDFLVGEPAWDQSGSKLYIKNQSGDMVLINPGNVDYGLLDGAVDGSFDYGSLM